MTEEQALEHLTLMMITLQKYRSTTAIELGGLTDEMAASSWPWVFGDKCPLPQLVKVLDQESVEPQQYYNFMYIAHHFMPEIVLASIMIGRADTKTPTGLPDMPEISLLVHGWE